MSELYSFTGVAVLAAPTWAALACVVAAVLLRQTLAFTTAVVVACIVRRRCRRFQAVGLSSIFKITVSESPCVASIAFVFSKIWFKILSSNIIADFYECA